MSHQCCFLVTVPFLQSKKSKTLQDSLLAITCNQTSAKYILQSHTEVTKQADRQEILSFMSMAWWQLKECVFHMRLTLVLLLFQLFLSLGKVNWWFTFCKVATCNPAHCRIFGLSIWQHLINLNYRHIQIVTYTCQHIKNFSRYIFHS